MKEVARKFKEMGLAPVPVGRNKKPPVTWGERENSEGEFEGVFGVALKCGEKSGGLEILDFDNDFEDATENMKKFFSHKEVAEIHENHTLPIEKTPNGGYHVYFKCSKVGRNDKLAQRPYLDGKKWTAKALIETRGEGGYVICDPTEGYKIIRGSLAEIPEITPEERDELIRVAMSYQEYTQVIKEKEEKGDRPGDYYNNDPKAIDEMVGLLENEGWQQVSEYRWRRPGKEEGVSATIGYVDDHIFYNFSSNSFPFNPEKAYTPFQVKAILEFEGDFEACAKSLAKKYGLEGGKEKKEAHNQNVSFYSDSDLRAMLKKAKIDLSKKIEEPPTILKIKDTDIHEEKRVYTLGNFSAITGKSKSKKTFLMVMVTATMQVGGMQFNKFRGSMPEEKKDILYFDTEQSEYDAWNTVKKVETLTGMKDRFHPFCLREYDALDRCKLIEYAIENTPNVGLVVIDGIADLAKAINDEDEGTRVAQLLLKWTKENNCHITTIIHQNKKDNFATGHLGSFVMKKAEAVISVEKDSNDPKISNVKCDLIRGVGEFEPFSFTVNHEGLPELIKE